MKLRPGHQFFWESRMGENHLFTAQLRRAAFAGACLEKEAKRKRKLGFRRLGMIVRSRRILFQTALLTSSRTKGALKTMAITTSSRSKQQRKMAPSRSDSDESARDELILGHLGYVKHILNKLLNQLPAGVDAENLESAGIVGLIEAATQYDPERRVEFRTFSYQRIRGAILDELRRNCPLSQQMLQKIAHLRQVRLSIQGPVTIEELSKAADMSLAEVSRCMQGARLTRPEGWNDSVRVQGHIGDNQDVAPVEQQEMQQVLADGIETLPDQMRIAVALHYNEGLKLKEVGNVLGLSESRVSRILDAARTRLRDYAAGRGY